MVNLFGFAFLFSGIAFLFWLLQAVLKKGRRRKALLGCGVALLAVGGSLVGFSMATNSEAIEQGFLSSTDRSRAKEAGYEEAEQWAAVRERYASQREAARQLEAESRLVESGSTLQAQAEASGQLATPEEIECRKDLICWGEKQLVWAGVMCPPEIEKLATYGTHWTDSWLELKFSRYLWLDKERGTLTMVGDALEFENGFGAKANMIYECDIDPVAEVILEVRAFPGRL